MGSSRRGAMLGLLDFQSAKHALRAVEPTEEQYGPRTRKGDRDLNLAAHRQLLIDVLSGDGEGMGGLRFVAQRQGELVAGVRGEDCRVEVKAVHLNVLAATTRDVLGPMVVGCFPIDGDLPAARARTAGGGGGGATARRSQQGGGQYRREFR